MSGKDYIQSVHQFIIEKGNFFKKRKLKSKSKQAHVIQVDINLRVKINLQSCNYSSLNKTTTSHLVTWTPHCSKIPLSSHCVL